MKIIFNLTRKKTSKACNKSWLRINSLKDHFNKLKAFQTKMKKLKKQAMKIKSFNINL